MYDVYTFFFNDCDDNIKIACIMYILLTTALKLNEIYQ